MVWLALVGGDGGDFEIATMETVMRRIREIIWKVCSRRILSSY